MRKCLLWVAMSLNGFTFRVGCGSSKRERLGQACSLDSCNLAACGHWWHLYVHFQDMLGKPSRKMFWSGQKWGFLEASEEMNKWSDRRENEAIAESFHTFSQINNKKSTEYRWKESSIFVVVFFFVIWAVIWRFLYISKWTWQPSAQL